MNPRGLVQKETTRIASRAMDYETIAEEYEGYSYGSGSGSAGGSKKRKRKAVPTQVGKVRVGGSAWGAAEKVCPKGCLKKCCA